MDMRPCTLGLDLGTSSVKALAFDDATGALVAQAHEAVAVYRDEPGASEADPHQIVALAEAALASANASASQRGFAVRRVGISAAMHSLLPIDDHNRPLARALLWSDTRAEDIARRLWDSLQGTALYQRTGTPIHPMSPLCKLVWLRETRPDLVRQAARWVSLKEWLWHQWLGVWQVDVALANATGLLNMNSLRWDDDALLLCGLTPAALSNIVPVTTAATGAAVKNAGIEADVTFVIGASDGTLAQIAGHAAGSISLTLGTSAAVRVMRDAPYTDLVTRPFCYALDAGHRVVGYASNSGGDLLAWCARLWFAGDVGALSTEASSVRSDGMVCLPYVYGERAPLWDGDAAGALVGLRADHTRAQIARACVEGILMNARWLVDQVRPLAPDATTIVASGGMLDAEWIGQLAADITGLPIIAHPDVDASASGAAAIARLASGEITWADLTQRDADGSQARYFPQPDSALEATYRQFRDLVHSLYPSTL
jgi:gluconokinase